MKSALAAIGAFVGAAVSFLGGFSLVPKLIMVMVGMAIRSRAGFLIVLVFFAGWPMIPATLVAGVLSGWNPGVMQAAALGAAVAWGVVLHLMNGRST